MRKERIRDLAIWKLDNSLAKSLVVFMSIAAILWFAIYHQPYYPVAWLDEGFVLQGPMNLVRFGTYAMRSTEG
ncbi:MAG: hypothetical protein JXB30_12310 [Anaerolineae bacterium]|nr:hypothetical protein [Anaerolineae bacterium]